MTNAGAIGNFHATDNSALFKFKQKITGKTAVVGKKNCWKNDAIKVFK